MKSSKPLNNIAEKFQITGDVLEVLPIHDGHIHDTYKLVTSGPPGKNEYILQHKNNKVFKDVPAMMDNIQKVTSHLKEKVISGKAPGVKAFLELVHTRSGELYYVDIEGLYWAMCVFIPGGITWQRVSSPEIAYEGGKSVGAFHLMLEDFREPLTDILPGFHDLRFRFDQWDTALKQDPVNRCRDVKDEISWIETRRDELMKFFANVENGIIPRRVAHNDTKISNVLFNGENQPLCMIDLDTVLYSTVLNDFGDAVRTYTNTGEEDDPDLSAVNIDLEVFDALCRGYLTQAGSFLSNAEKEFLLDGARFIIFEQVLRFLMDHINGDIYYKTGFPGHNLQRARAQYQLLDSLERNYKILQGIVKKYS